MTIYADPFASHTHHLIAKGALLGSIAVASTAVSHCLITKVAPHAAFIALALLLATPCFIHLMSGNLRRRKVALGIAGLQTGIQGLYLLSNAALNQSFTAEYTPLAFQDCYVFTAHIGSFLLTYLAFNRIDTLLRILSSVKDFVSPYLPRMRQHNHSRALLPTGTVALEELTSTLHYLPHPLRGPPHFSLCA